MRHIRSGGLILWLLAAVALIRPGLAGQHIDIIYGRVVELTGVVAKGTVSALFLSGVRAGTSGTGTQVACITVSTTDGTDAGCDFDAGGTIEVDPDLNSATVNVTVPSDRFAGGTLQCAFTASAYGSFEVPAPVSGYISPGPEVETIARAKVVRDADVTGSCSSSTVGGGALRPGSSALLLEGVEGIVWVGPGTTRPIPTTTRASVPTDSLVAKLLKTVGIENELLEEEPNGASLLGSISADGRYVAFASGATNLAEGDTNGVADAYVRDRYLGVTTRVSVASDGTQANGATAEGSPVISADGRIIAFSSRAFNLVPGDTNGAWDVFVHDRVSGTTERVNLDSNEQQSAGDPIGFGVSVSYGGDKVAFRSAASDLVPGDTNGLVDAFVRDRSAGTTERVSVSSADVEANNFSTPPAIAGDGGFVAFASRASNLVPGDTNNAIDVFVRDLSAGTTERVSLTNAGGQANGTLPSVSSLSTDGRFVTFTSAVATIVPGDTNGAADIFVRDRVGGTTTRVSVGTGGTQANDDSIVSAISADGRWVAFWSEATNLVPGDANGVVDVFVHDRTGAATERASVSTTGTEADAPSYQPMISADGSAVVFHSAATNLVEDDTNGLYDVFVRDR